MGDLLMGRFPAFGGSPGRMPLPAGDPGVGAEGSGGLPSGAAAGGAFAFGSVPWQRDQRLWWLLWSRCPGLGWVRLRSLERGCGGLDAAWRLPSAGFARLPGWHAGLVPVVERFRGHWGVDPLARLLRDPRVDRRVLLPGDGRWPAAIGALERPPLGLWWQGRGTLWSLLARRRAVAVVGTRRPSPHGLAMARALGLALAQAGWPVVSGLAEGIDGAVHGGCLAGDGAPVGVLGTPLERVYPQHHGQLQRAVGQRGLLLSEQPPGAQVHRGNFAGRNRLLVALAAAVVVVECPPDSGALHSAAYAWEQGLPLWVVPGDAGRHAALGSNRLLCQGATPLLAPEDLVAFLGPGPLAPSFGAVAAASRPSADPAGSEQERLLAAVGEGASLEQISLQLGRPASELAVALFQLEWEGMLRAQPGLRWQRC
ncbi:MAG: hypothetical protein RLZZ206_520 [Cyanobacteriota bacterium]